MVNASGIPYPIYIKMSKPVGLRGRAPHENPDDQPFGKARDEDIKW